MLDNAIFQGRNKILEIFQTDKKISVDFSLRVLLHTTPNKYVCLDLRFNFIKVFVSNLLI